MKVYLDSCMLIYRLEGPERFSKPVEEKAQQASDASFCISELVWLECLVQPLRSGNERLKDAYERILGEIECLTFTRAIWLLAAEIRAEYRLRTPDALHAAAAIR